MELSASDGHLPTHIYLSKPAIQIFPKMKPVAIFTVCLILLCYSSFSNVAAASLFRPFFATDEQGQLVLENIENEPTNALLKDGVVRSAATTPVKLDNAVVRQVKQESVDLNTVDHQKHNNKSKAQKQRERDRARRQRQRKRDQERRRRQRQRDRQRRQRQRQRDRERRRRQRRRNKGPKVPAPTPDW